MGRSVAAILREARVAAPKAAARLTPDELALKAIRGGVLVVDTDTGAICTGDGRKADGPDGEYLRVNLNGRPVRSHRVVWLAAFGPIPPGDWEINHRNRIKTDNRITNLELVLHQGNMDHWRGTEGYLRIGVNDDGAIDPRRLPELLAGIKSETPAKASTPVYASATRGPRGNRRTGNQWTGVRLLP